MPGKTDHSGATPFLEKNFKEAKKSFEREFLRLRLEENNGNISQTAITIGMERSHLHKKIKGLELEVEGE